jgi:hypothetical protein
MDSSGVPFGPALSHPLHCVLEGIVTTRAAIVLLRIADIIRAPPFLILCSRRCLPVASYASSSIPFTHTAMQSTVVRGTVARQLFDLPHRCQASRAPHSSSSARAGALWPTPLPPLNFTLLAPHPCQASFSRHTFVHLCPSPMPCGRLLRHLSIFEIALPLQMVAMHNS